MTILDQQETDQLIELQRQGLESMLANKEIKRAQLLQVSTAIFCSALANPNIGGDASISKSIAVAKQLIEDVNQVDL